MIVVDICTEGEIMVGRFAEANSIPGPRVDDAAGSGRDLRE